jgi:hypothetical protein
MPVPSQPAKIPNATSVVTEMSVSSLPAEIPNAIPVVTEMSVPLQPAEIPNATSDTETFDVPLQPPEAQNNIPRQRKRKQQLEFLFDSLSKNEIAKGDRKERRGKK